MPDLREALRTQRPSLELQRAAADEIARLDAVLAAMAQSDYRAWYEEAMVASNEAGFAGVSAADTIRFLAAERSQALELAVKE